MPLKVVPVRHAGFRRVNYEGHAKALVDLTPVRGGWRLRAEIGNEERVVDVDVTIRSRGPGPTMVARHPGERGLLRRAMPVMDGVARGRSGGTRIRGWRAAIVHDWWTMRGLPPGCCDRTGDGQDHYPRCCDATDALVVHGKGEATAVIGGFTHLGPNEAAGWRGVVARRRGGRLTWCAATRHRVTYRAISTHTISPKTLHVRCGGTRVRMRAIESMYRRYDAFVGARRTRDALWFQDDFE